MSSKTSRIRFPVAIGIPMIVLAMGELGFPTRVLSPVFGGVYTYAAPMFAAGTSAGQVSARLLRHRRPIPALVEGR